MIGLWKYGGLLVNSFWKHFTKLQNETNKDPLTTKQLTANAIAIGAHRASVSPCGEWANLAFPLI